MKLKVEPLTPEAFAPFGRVLAKPQHTEADAVREDLDAWIGISDLLGLEAKEPVFAYLHCKRHSLAVNQIERHCKGAEAFIPLEGSSILIVAGQSDPDDPDAVPDESQLRAFLMDGTAAVFLPAGSWHWAPFPISESATFLLLLDKHIGDDVEIRNMDTHTIELY